MRLFTAFNAVVRWFECDTRCTCLTKRYDMWILQSCAPLCKFLKLISLRETCVLFGDAASTRIRMSWDSSSSLDISISPANITKGILDVESYLHDAESESSVHRVIRPSCML